MKSDRLLLGGAGTKSRLVAGKSRPEQPGWDAHAAFMNGLIENGFVLRIGVLTPHATPGPEAEFPEMAPGRLVMRVARVSTGAGADDITAVSGQQGALRTLTAPPFLDDAAKMLASDAVDVIGYASTTSAYVIGFDAETAMVSRLSHLAGMPVAATCASAVRALRVFNVGRVALIGAPWFDREFNRLGAEYFRSQGFDVVSSESARLSQDPQRIEPTGVSAWALRHVRDDAEAIFFGGNGFRAAGAIERLEAALGRPVLTANQVLLWGLLAQVGDSPAVRGYGRLFEHEG